MERLDRAFLNSGWIDLFPRHRLFNLVISYSDHSPNYVGGGCIFSWSRFRGFGLRIHGCLRRRGKANTRFSMHRLPKRRRVKELFKSGEEEFIIGILTPDSARIMKFPVNLVKSPNCMVWHFNTDGKYSIKTGYRVALQDFFDFVPDRERLPAKDLNVIPNCYRCGSSERRGEEGSITHSNLIHLVLSQPLIRRLFAAVLRNDTSQFIMAYSSYVTTTMEPHFGEALAIRKVLSWLKGLRLDRTIIETDCLRVVNSLHAQDIDVSEFGLLVQDCRNVASHFQH
ncbi:hypothetical protein Gotur_002200 [Gossypium turneri]